MSRTIISHIDISSVHSCHDDHVPGLLHKLVQKQSRGLPLEVHVLVAHHSASLCGKTSHTELLAEGRQTNRSRGEEKKSNWKGDQVSMSAESIIFIRSNFICCFYKNPDRWNTFYCLFRNWFGFLPEPFILWMKHLIDHWKVCQSIQSP